MAATFCLAPQALADPSAAQGTAHHAVVADAASRLDPLSAQLLSAIKQTETAQTARQQTGSSQASWYTVKAGDSLSVIAERSYHNQNAWPVLYWANRNRIHWANVIEPGQVLRIPVKPAKIPDPPSLLGPAPAPVAETAAPEATAEAAPSQGAADVSSSATPSGSFAQCVIARESGGQSQVMNGSGHYGLYQFSASTWAAYGGSPTDFGNASVSEQNQVFNNAVASGGQSNWSAYDGC
ncbi:MAG: transglycosylase family protein [Streptosporangiaceae bacterium]